jgi:hypothetical protein
MIKAILKAGTNNLFQVNGRCRSFTLPLHSFEICMHLKGCQTSSEKHVCFRLSVQTLYHMEYI